jgi:hypothetical protein
MKVWILECDHEPIVGLPFFRDDCESTTAMKVWLNSLPTDQEHYYDAVLYERIEPGK